jgi:hypothetical protein
MHVRECNAAKALQMLCMLRPASAASMLRLPRSEPLHAGSPAQGNAGRAPWWRTHAPAHRCSCRRAIRGQGPRRCPRVPDEGQRGGRHAGPGVRPSFSGAVGSTRHTRASMTSAALTPVRASPRPRSSATIRTRTAIAACRRMGSSAERLRRCLVQVGLQEAAHLRGGRNLKPATRIGACRATHGTKLQRGDADAASAAQVQRVWHAAPSHGDLPAPRT